MVRDLLDIFSTAIVGIPVAIIILRILFKKSINRPDFLSQKPVFLYFREIIKSGHAKKIIHNAYSCCVGN